MREIKFRAWVKGTHKMLPWEWVHDNFFSRIFDNPDIIPMQYTGLKDKNGKEIYEGDILFTPGGQRLSVGIDYAMFGDPKFWSIEANECAVIGNIYENPELLELGPPHDEIV